MTEEEKRSELPVLEFILKRTTGGSDLASELRLKQSPASDETSANFKFVYLPPLKKQNLLNR
jgi:hypothetical protein